MSVIPTSKEDCLRLAREIMSGKHDLSGDLGSYVAAFKFGWNGLLAEATDRETHQWRLYMNNLGIEFRKKRIDSAIGRYFKERKPAFDIFAKHGWFSDPNMSTAKLNQLSKAKSDVVNDEFSTWFKDRTSAIEKELVEKHRKRSRFISGAFWAHRRKKYIFSVTTFLVQADGIWYDNFGASVFSRKEREEIQKKESAYNLKGIETIFEPLSQRLSLWLNKSEREEHSNDFNRHLVLHGIDTAYDTEERSLKAMAFIWWSHQSIDALDTVISWPS